MRRLIGTAMAAVVLATGCASGGVSEADYDLVVSELSVANQDLALVKQDLVLATEELTAATEAAATAAKQTADAVEDKRAAEAELLELQDEMDELFDIDVDEQRVMERQQALGVLGTLFVEFRNGPWDEQTVEMFSEFVQSTGEPEIIGQLDVFAAAIAENPAGESASYEYGILGYSIMSALENEIVDPFGAG